MPNSGLASNLIIVNQDYRQAQEIAESEEKLILLDVYAEWCGPCKKFEKIVETHPSFADSIAKNFVLLRYDGEKDNHLLAQKHHIRSFPTFIILNSEGRVVAKQYGRFKGESSIDSYLDFLKKSKSNYDEGVFIEGVSTVVDLKFPTYYKEYINRQSRKYKEANMQYWSKKTKVESELDFILLLYFGAPEVINKYYTENYGEFRSLYGVEDASRVLIDIFEGPLEDAVEQEDMELLNEIKKECRSICGEEADESILYYELELLYKKEDWAQLVTFVEGKLRNEGIDDFYVNVASWKIYENCDDERILSKAAEIMKSVVVRSPNYAELDTYAWLLQKLDRVEEAQEVASKAIEQGLKEGQDVSSTKEIFKLK